MKCVPPLPPRPACRHTFVPPEEYGSGEEIDVTVTFNFPVVVLPGAVLLLDTGDDGQSSGMALYHSGNGSNSITFLYTVAGRDESVDLGTYERGEAGEGGGLVGTVLRDSDAPTQVSRRNRFSILFFFELFHGRGCRFFFSWPVELA